MDVTAHQAFGRRPFHERFGLWLGLAIIVQMALHAFVMVCWSGRACGAVQSPVDHFGYMVDLSRENNIPAWFSFTLLLLVAVAAAVLSATVKSGKRPWFWLSVLFVYMSLDEATDLHGLWPKVFDLSGMVDPTYGLFLWVVPGAVLVLVIGLCFLRWVLTLPRRTKAYFLTAGAVYVTGGLGLEVLGATIADPTYFNPAYLVVSTVEEALEMLGVVIMLMGLAAHAETIGLRVTVDAV
jgi:hypothetical protein